ncbi:MAG: acyl phosphate:glycerol-3-phosphate acyltransferase [Verrucomicrobiota bacterium]
MFVTALTIAFLGYLFGSFPTGYFVGRLAGVDIRSVGSGNIGATNVLRVLGKRWGYTVFFVDAFKGFAAVRLALFIARQMPNPAHHPEYFGIIAALLCIVGHTFPVWLRFKGGKGVATSAGALFGLMPMVVPFVVLAWIAIFEITRYVSVASIIASVSLPVAVWLFLRWGFLEGPALLYFSLAIAGLVLWRHRPNFSRLLNGTEQRFSRK